MAGGIQYRVQVHGIQDVINRARRMPQQLIDEIDTDVEITTLETINAAKADAPVLSSKLRNGLQMIPQDAAKMKRTWGGSAEYTRRQEYEHKTRKGFMRRAQFNARTKLRERVRATIARIGR